MYMGSQLWNITVTWVLWDSLRKVSSSGSMQFIHRTAISAASPILHKPVILSILGSIADCQHTVVQLSTATIWLIIDPWIIDMDNAIRSVTSFFLNTQSPPPLLSAHPLKDRDSILTTVFTEQVQFIICNSFSASFAHWVSDIKVQVWISRFTPQRSTNGS